MQVMLQENYPSLGFVGDVVKVKDGFARNFLFPQKIAVPANKKSLGLFEHQQKVIEIKKSQKKSEAEQYKDKIEGVEVRISHAVSEGKRLFGSVTVAEIQAELEKCDIQVDRRLIRLESPIKQLGDHYVDVKLHQEVTAKLKVIVETKETKSLENKEDQKQGEKKSSRARATKKASASDGVAPEGTTENHEGASVTDAQEEDKATPEA